MAVGTDTIGSVIIKFLADTKNFDTGAQTLATRLKTMESGFQSLATNMRSVGAQLLGFGAVVSAPLLAGVKSMMDFDAEFQKVMSIMSTPMDQSAIDGLKAGIMDLSRTMGIDLVEATRGVYQALSSGVPTDNVLEFIQSAAKAAIAGNTDLFSSVTVIAGAVNAYGRETLSAERAADLMFQTVKDGMIEFKDLAEGMGQVSALGAQAGVTFEEINAALATMTAVGLSPAESFTALRGILVSIISPSKDASEASKELGLNWDAATLKSKGWAAMMEDLRVKTGGNVEAIARIIPEVRGMNGALLVGAQNGAIFTRELENMKNSTGSLDKAFAEIEKSLKHVWERVKANMKAALVEIGEALRKDLTDALDQALAKLKELQSWISNNPDDFRATVQTWKDWAIAITAVGVAFMSLSVVASTIKNIITVAGVLVATGTRLLNFFAFLRALPILFATLSDAAGAFGVSLAGIASVAALPLAAIVAALGLIGYTVYGIKRAHDEARDSMTQTYDAATKAADHFGIRSNDVLKKYEAAVKSATDANDKMAKQQQYVDEVSRQVAENSRAREIEFQKAMDAQVVKMGNVKDALNITDAAWLIHKETGVDAATAVTMATYALADAHATSAPRMSRSITDAANTAIDMYKKMSDEERKNMEQGLQTAEERSKYLRMSANDQRAFVNEHIKANDFMNLKDSERTEIMMLYRNKEISIDQAVLAVKNHMTNEEIALLEKGANAQDVIAARKKSSGDEDSAQLAAKLAKDQQTMDAFVSGMQTRIDALIRQRDILNAAAETAAKAGDASQFLNYSQQAEAATRSITAAQNELSNVRAQAHEKMVDQYAKEMGIEYERADVAMKAGEIEKKAIEERKERLGATFDQVINNLGQYKGVYDQLNADQKVAVDALIANVLDAGIAVNNTQKGIADAQKQATDAARNSLASMSNEAVAANQNFTLSFTQQAEAMGKISPSLQQSISSVTQQIQQQQQEVRVNTEQITFHEQAIKTLTNSEGNHATQIQMHKDKLVELTAKMKESQEGYNIMTAGLSGNRTAMIEASSALADKISKTEQEIIKTRESGKSTADLNVTLQNLNAQYDVLKVGMDRVGLSIDPVTKGMKDTGVAAKDAATGIGDMARASNDTKESVSKLAQTTQNELPNSTADGLSRTQSTWSRFLDWLWEKLGMTREKAAYTLNPAQTGSPSLNMEIARGFEATNVVYEENVGRIMRVFSSARDAQVKLYRDMSSEIGSQSHYNAKEKHNSQLVTKTQTQNGWVQMPDGSWAFVQGLSSTSEYVPLPNTPKKPVHVSEMGMSGGVAMSERVAEIMRRVDARLAELKDRSRLADALSAFQATLGGGADNIAGLAMMRGSVGGSNEISIADDEQTSLAEKIGVAVAKAIVPQPHGWALPAININVPAQRQAEHRSTNNRRRLDEDEMRRTYY